MLGKIRQFVRLEFPISGFDQDVAVHERLIEIIEIGRPGQDEKPDWISEDRVSSDAAPKAALFAQVFARLMNLIHGETRMKQLLGPRPSVSGMVIHNCRRPGRVDVRLHILTRNDGQHCGEQELPRLGVVSPSVLTLDRIVKKNCVAEDKRSDKGHACGMIAIDKKEQDQQERTKQRKARDLRSAQGHSQNEEQRRQSRVDRGAGILVDQADRREESRRRHDEPQTIRKDEALVGQRKGLDQASARAQEGDDATALAWT